MNVDHVGSTRERVLYPVATDGVPLAVYEYGDKAHPTVVLIHGFPDSHTVWRGVIALLQDRFHVVAYDVRGTGQSGAPSSRSGYRLEQLSKDLEAVLRLTSPHRPVHVLAHDWGSIQSWESVTDPRFEGRLLSFTSISGPSFDMTGVWLRNGYRYFGNAARQLLDFWYVFAFQLPMFPELLARYGVIEALVTRMESPTPSRQPPSVARRSRRDAINGIHLYRANVRRLLLPRPRPAICPVLVLAPTHDAFVTAPLAVQSPAPFVRGLRAEEINGGHWVVEDQPHLVVDHFLAFLASLDLETRPSSERRQLPGQPDQQRAGEES